MEPPSPALSGTSSVDAAVFRTVLHDVALRVAEVRATARRLSVESQDLRAASVEARSRRRSLRAEALRRRAAFGRNGDRASPIARVHVR